MEEHLQKTEDERDPLGRKRDAAAAASDDEAARKEREPERPREPAPNPTQRRMDEQGLDSRPVDLPWWRRRRLRAQRGRNRGGE
ncbi:MAG: hypothetical protein C5B48_15605 [Candidatus Rokuibacteriota bacterium]|nr:MAG: hypothetical protein C5B48_15605 [Candidatus Rokubacteria bacterium]